MARFNKVLLHLNNLSTKNNEQKQQQTLVLPESNMRWKQVWLTANNMKQVPGPVFHNLDGKTQLYRLNPGFHCQPNFPLQCSGIDFSKEAEESWSPYSWHTFSGTPSWKRAHHPSCPVQWCCHRPVAGVAEACQPRQPNNNKNIKVMTTDLSHSECLATEELLNYLSDVSLSDGCVSHWILCFLYRRQVSRTEDILKVFLSLYENIAALHFSCKQCWQSTASSSWGAQWNFFKVRPMALLQGLPNSSHTWVFAFCNCLGCTILGLLLPISSLRSSQASQAQ